MNYGILLLLFFPFRKQKTKRKLNYWQSRAQIACWICLTRPLSFVLFSKKYKILSELMIEEALARNINESFNLN